jgi:hypothetical protein
MAPFREAISFAANYLLKKEMFPICGPKASAEIAPL